MKTPQPPLRIGLYGSGFIAGVHAASLKKLHETEIVAIADAVPGAATTFAAKHEIPKSFQSFTAMLESTELDAIYFCVPPFAHQGEVQTAAAKGIHIFLEKPIALSSSQATDMVEAIEKAAVKSQVGFHMRHRKSVKAAKRSLESGEAGRPTLFSGRYWTNMQGSSWWRDQNKSGGQIFEQVIHLYDLACYLCGEVASARGIIRNLCHANQADYTIEDTSIGTLQFANGGLGVITGSNCAVRDHYIGDFKLVCEKLTLDYNCTGQHWITSDSAKIHRGDEIETFTEDEDPYYLETVDFVSAILEDRPTVAPARHGLEAIQVVEAVLADAAR